MMWRCVIAFLAVLMMTFGGCAVSSIQAEEPNKVDCTAVDIESWGHSHHDIYELSSPDSEFNSVINENAIDKAYHQEIQLATTVDEFVQTERKYIDLWLAELEDTTDKYMRVISEDDAAAFLNTQDTFSDYINSSFKYDFDMLQEHKYDIHTGEVSRWLVCSAQREAIRERVIHIKYLHYLLERAGGKLNGEYESLAFTE